MRRLKDWSGLGFKQLESRARRLGSALPHSTLAAVLARESLPRPELLEAFVRACGCSEAETKRWLECRARLAIGEPPTTVRDDVCETDGSHDVSSAPDSVRWEITPRRSDLASRPVEIVKPRSEIVTRRRRHASRSDGRRTIFVGVMVTAVMSGVAGIAFGDTILRAGTSAFGKRNSPATFVSANSPNPLPSPAAFQGLSATTPPVTPTPTRTPTPSPKATAMITLASNQPADGRYRFRPMHAYSSNLCAMVDEKGERLVLMLATCDKSVEQQYSVEATAKSVDRIKPRSRRLGSSACVSVDASGGNGQVHLRNCGDQHAAQSYTIERTRAVSKIGALYRVRPTVHPAKCFSVPGRSTKKGTVLTEQDCTGTANQEFALEKAEG